MPVEWKRASGFDDHGVEVAVENGYLLVRNSAIPLEVIRFKPDEWDVFVHGVKRGEFDLIGPVFPG